MLDPLTTAAIANFLVGRASKALDALLAPMAREAGEDLLARYRAWRARSAADIVRDSAEMASAAGYNLRPVPGRVLMPILEYASLEEDESLRRKWAALLANAASSAGWSTTLPAYAEILRQLTPIHASVLDLLYKAHGDSASFEPEPLASDHEWHGYQPTEAATVIEKFELTKQTYSVLASDLHRLQVIDGSRWNATYYGGGPSGPTSYDSIHITPLGRGLVRACTPPKPTSPR